MVVACRRARRRIVCRIARRPITSRCVRDGLVSDRVPYRPSPDGVSSRPGPCRRPACSCPIHGRTSGTPVVCHAPAQHGRELTPPTAVYERLFFYMAVAFHECPFGGAAKAGRWAARIPSRGRRTVLAARHHRTSSEHIRTYPGLFGYEMIIACRIVRRRSRRPVRPVAAGMARRRIACRRARRVRYRPSPDTASRMVVACEMICRRIACRTARRVRDSSSPDTAERMVVACGIAGRRIACGSARRSLISRHIPAHLGDLTPLPCLWSGKQNARRLPCPGPTWPVADAASSGLRTYILLYGRGVLSWRVRRRG